MILELQATPEEVMRAVDALREFGAQRGVSERVLFGMALALEECGSNIVNHALDRDAARIFQVSFEVTSDALVVELRDEGPAFDPTGQPASEPRAVDDHPPGGWGIQLARRQVDEMSYIRVESTNVLRLVSKI